MNLHRHLRSSTRLLRAAPALVTLAFLGACASSTPTQQRNIDGYPTLERVQFVHECMKQHPGPRFEMESKCSCTLDRLAEKLSYEQFSTYSTDANATSIGGERGGALRDNEGVQSAIKQWRQLQAEAKKACFINTDAR